MATVEQPQASRKIASSREEIVTAIENGELVRLMAEVDAGRISREDFEAALEKYRRKRFLRWILDALLGR